MLTIFLHFSSCLLAGGTYGNTVNRLAGLVAGTVLPSIFNFFLCKVSNDILYNFLNNFVLFFWTVGSMYVYFSGSYMQNAGMVSAYMAASVMLEHSCRSQSTQLGTLSYSTLTENALGILILMAVELTMQPKSATSLLRKNVQDMLKQYGEVFHLVFRHHLANGSPETNSQRMNETEMKALRKRLSVTLPQLLTEQARLLHDASSEPTLWRPEFSYDKYAQVLTCCRILLARLRILLDLVEWHEKRRNSGLGARLQRPRAATLDAECRAAAVKNGDETSPVSPSPPVLATPSNAQLQWLLSQDAFEATVEDTLDTLSQLFSKEFSYSNSEETVIFMQMKEAFRIADVHRRGEVDAAELALFLEKLLPYSAIGNVQIEQYVDEFMCMVDKNHDGKISFAEFMKALNEGFRLELEIYETTAAETENRVLSGRKSVEVRPSRAASVGLQVSVPAAKVAAHEGEVVISIDSAASGEPLSKARSTNNEADRITLNPQFYNNAPPLSVGSRRRPSMENSAEALLNVESFTVKQAAAALKNSYGEHLMLQYNEQHHVVPMEDFIVMSCLITTCEGIAANLSQLNALAAT